MTPIIILSVLALLCIVLGWQNAIMSFKIGYYEQTFRNNKDHFTEGRYSKIEEIMKLKSLFDIRKMINFMDKLEL